MLDRPPGPDAPRESESAVIGTAYRSLEDPDDRLAGNAALVDAVVALWAPGSIPTVERYET